MSVKGQQTPSVFHWPSSGTAGDIYLKNICLAFAYFCIAKLGLLMAIEPGYATVFWPSSGLALAAVIIYGYRLLPGVWIGSAAINFLNYLPASDGEVFVQILVGSMIACGAAMQAAAGRWMVCPRNDVFNSKIETPAEVWQLIVMGGLSCLCSATVGTMTLLCAEKIPLETVLFTWGTWFTGDVLGVIVFTPLVLLLAARDVRLSRKQHVAIPMTIAFIAAIGVFYSSALWHKKDMLSDFEHEAGEIRQNLASALNTFSLSTNNLQGFFHASQNVDAGEFDTFVTSGMVKSAGFSRAIYAPLIMKNQRAEFEKKLAQSDIVNNYITEMDGEMLRRAETKESYVPILYAYPHYEKTSVLQAGFDLSSENARRLALEAARHSESRLPQER